MDPRSNAEDSLAPWLRGRPFAQWKRAFDDRGYVVFENVLSATQLEAIRAALAPWLKGGKLGRNDFEGFSTNRVYALLAKGRVFADLAIHPLALAFAEADLGPSLLLSSCLAINLHPGETVQAWHFDDAPVRIPRPRPPCGVSTFWAIDATTEANGATEVIPEVMSGARRASWAIALTPWRSACRPDRWPSPRARCGIAAAPIDRTRRD